MLLGKGKVRRDGKIIFSSLPSNHEQLGFSKGLCGSASWHGSYFANRNDDPELLMEAATWWIKKHQLDQFEKALKIKKMVEAGL
ncbi:DUF6500 family protein [Marinimicrobium locisalis]|uniref:DUF6500 family protein n=1 Tax=Marinimicrobium locisalis TaxID=546022 RepID=UPI003221C3C5